MVHARARAKKRFGLKLTKDDLLLIAGRIRHKNNVEFIGFGNNGTEKWKVTFMYEILTVVYDSRTGKICTIF